MSFTDAEIFEAFAEETAAPPDGRDWSVDSRSAAKRPLLRNDRQHTRIGQEKRRAQTREWERLHGRKLLEKRLEKCLCVTCGKKALPWKRGMFYQFCKNHLGKQRKVA